ncbi:MAG TPA: hypothetical protein VHX86_09225 [Tepidisphaeraceae bacterium]|nr:hypothetical protein [Tepidisphaeraceae bacterium]
MFYALFHRMLFPALVTTIVGAIWVVGWTQTLTDEVEKGTWPALPVSTPAVQTSAAQSQAAVPRSCAGLTPSDSSRTR